MILAFLGLVMAAGPVAGQDAAGEEAALRDYFAGNGLLNRGMYDLAATEYRRFLQAHPNHEKVPVARYGLAVSLFRLGQHGAALVELKRLRGVPRFSYAAEVLMILGRCQLALNDRAEAARTFAGLLRDHADHELADDAAALQAEALYEAGEYKQVEVPCSLLRSRWPKSPHRERAELLWGLSQMALGEYRAAALRFEAISRRYPDGQYADQTALLRAQSLHHAKAIAEAIAQYRRVIARARQEYVPEAIYGLAVLLHQNGKLGHAGNLLDRLVQEYPEHRLVAAGRLLRGRVWFDEGEYGRAFELFEAASSAGREHRDDALYWMAKCELRDGKPAEAARRLEKAMGEFPKSELVAEMTYDRAVALVRADDPEAALKILKRFQAKYTNHVLAADAMHLVAATLHQKREFRQSLELAREFAGRYPTHGMAVSVA